MRTYAFGLSLASLALAGGAWAAADAPQSDATPARHGWAKPETRAEAQTKAEALFDKLDVNHDGKLDQADRTAHEAEMFDKMDTNHDGSISRDEFMAAHQRGPMRQPGAAGPDGDHHGKRGPGKDGMGHMDGGMMMVRMADANKDGVVTKDEFVAAALKRFDAMDADHDGTVTPAERKAAMAAMRTKWRDRKGGDMPPPPPPGE